MSIGALTNIMRLQAQLAAGGTVSVRVGLVTNYDPTRYTAKVALQPNGQLTNWLQVATLWVGNGWGLYSPPAINEMVVVLLVEGKQNAGIVLGRLFNTQDVPTEVQSGEFWLVHAKGQSVKLTNDGAVTVSDGQGAIVEFDGSGNINSQANQWNHSGPVNIDGDVSVTGDVNATGTVTGQEEVVGGAGAIKLSTHSHSDPQGGDVGAPINP